MELLCGAFLGCTKNFPFQQTLGTLLLVLLPPVPRLFHHQTMAAVLYRHKVQKRLERGASYNVNLAPDYDAAAAVIKEFLYNHHHHQQSGSSYSHIF